MSLADRIFMGELQRWATSDVDAVKQFEAFVHGQKCAETPWAPVTDYSEAARNEAEGKHPALILEHLIATSSADIFDYGCGPQAHLIRLLRAAARDTDIGVYGYDPQLWGSKVPTGSRLFDLVICREVLEHCTVLEARKVVSDLVRLSSRLVYVTTRFAQAPSHLLHVEDHDDLDPTHITMLTKPFLRTLFILEGCTSRYDLEAKMDWKGLGRCLVMQVQ